MENAKTMGREPLKQENNSILGGQKIVGTKISGGQKNWTQSRGVNNLLGQKCQSTKFWDKNVMGSNLLGGQQKYWTTNFFWGGEFERSACDRVKQGHTKCGNSFICITLYFIAL